MTWSLETSCGYESDKIAAISVPYLQGRALDIGCGRRKVWPGLVGVDSGHHFGTGDSDVIAEAGDLEIFSDASMNAVFSSHTLEHIEPSKIKGVLREWWRVLKVGGHLVLYLPHANLYPRMGEPGANPDHKVDFLPEDVIELLKQVAPDWTLVENETRDKGNEYSFFQVFRKRAPGDGQQEKLWQRYPHGCKRALVIRFGAIGDQIIAASVLPGLNAQGFAVTYMTTPEGAEIVKHDPNIFDWIVQAKEFVPNVALGAYWDGLAERYDRVVNLCESVEGGLLAMPGRLQHGYSDETRRKLFGGVNYLERTAEIAGVPFERKTARFYPTEFELKCVRAIISRKSRPCIVWVVNGSAAHKVYPWTQIVCKWLLDQTTASIVLMADPGVGKGLQDGIMDVLEREGCDMARVEGVARVWDVRRSLAFCQVADCVVGPETGPLNAVCMEDVPKVIYLSHSSPENLTKHWRNTTVLQPPMNVHCHPCHRLHSTWEFCHQSPETSAALCASSIKPERVFEAIMLAVGAKKAA